VEAIQQPAPLKRDAEPRVQTARSKRSPAPVQAVQQPAPPKPDADVNVQTAHLARSAEPVQAIQQPAPPKRDPEPNVQTTRSVEGTLQQVDCAGKAARLRLLVAGQQTMLLIEDVMNVSMKTAGRQVTHEFTCGPQEPVSVAILYEVKPDPMFNTDGLVRTLEFR
jgi:hypothetical protein